MPGLEVDSEGSLAFATTLVDEASSVIEHLKHRDQAVGVTISASNIAIDTANIGNCESNTSGSFGYFSYLF